MFDKREVAGENLVVAAASLVGVSGIALLAIGFVLQIIAWEFGAILQREPAGLTQSFLNCFGRRPSGYLIAVTFLFFWPMVGAFVHSALFVRDRFEFAIVFAYRFAACWAIAVLFVSGVAMLMGMSFVVLLSDLSGEPTYMGIVTAMSWAAPFGLMLLVTRWVWLASSFTRNEDGTLHVALKKQNSNLDDV